MTKAELLEKVRKEFHEAATVRLSYSGSGDGGSMSDVAYLDQNEAEIDVEIRNLDPLFDEWELLHDRILELSGVSGYWNNEGGAGTIEIDVATGKVTLNHGNYVTELTDEEPVVVDIE